MLSAIIKLVLILATSILVIIYNKKIEKIFFKINLYIYYPIKFQGKKDEKD